MTYFLVRLFAIAMGTVGRAYTFLVAFVAFLLGCYFAAMTQQVLLLPAFFIVGGLVAMRLSRWTQARAAGRRPQDQARTSRRPRPASHVASAESLRDIDARLRPPEPVSEANVSALVAADTPTVADDDA